MNASRASAIIWTAFLFIHACGATSDAATHTAALEAGPNAATSPAKREAQRSIPPTSHQGSIRRSRLNQVLEQGPGSFLQLLSVEAIVQGKRFQGFRIENIHTEHASALGKELEKHLQQGDIITRVNGMPIATPSEATRVWDSLSVASSLVVQIIRTGREEILRFEIQEG